MKLNRPTTFNVLQKRQTTPSVTGFELIQMNLLKTHLNKNEFIERSLIINSILSFSIFLIRSNLVKSFDLTRRQKIELRDKLVPFGDEYYNQSISLLRLVIARSKGNFDLTVIISELLNKVSMLEFKTLKNCLVFNNGLLGMIQNLISTEKIKNMRDYSMDLQIILKYLLIGGKAVQFPCYNYNVLYEIQGYLLMFEKTFKQRIMNSSNENINFQFNHLKYYIIGLIDQFESKQTLDYNLYYHNLRSWLVNLPNKLSVSEWVKDPLEYMILTFYKTMCTLLNNLFPQSGGIFLIGFSGNLEVFVQPNYTSTLKSFDNLNFDGYGDYEIDKLKELWSYFTRLKTLFTKRYNVLCIIFNYINFGSLVNIMGQPKLDNLEIIKCCNEIQIARFSETVLTNYHYPHITTQVEFNRYKAANTIDISTLEALPNPFSINTHHWDIIKHNYFKRYFERKRQSFAFFDENLDSSMSTNEQQHTYCNDLSLEDEYSDPVLQYLMDNLIRNPEQKNTGGLKIGYELFSNFVDSDRLGNDLEMDYFNLINQRLQYPVDIQIDDTTGLDYRDRDTLDYMVNNDFNFILHIDETFQLFNVDEFFNPILSMIKQLPETTLVDEEDLTEKFYDDLNDIYFL